MKGANIIAKSGNKTGFEMFWATYPKKIGKKAAETAWRKAKVTKDLLVKIIDSVEKAKKSKQWETNNGQYIPNPATWINQGRWDDEIDQCAGKPETSNIFADILRERKGAETNDS